MPLTTRRVPLRVTLQNLGFPKKSSWQDPPSYLRPARFILDPKHEWPEQVQRAFHEHRTEVDAGKLEFTHQYEKAWRLANRRFSWRGKDWKDPVIKLGERLAAQETLGRAAFEAYRDAQMAPGARRQTFHEFRRPLASIEATTNPLEMKLEIKDRMDFGGEVHGRVVAPA